MAFDISDHLAGGAGSSGGPSAGGTTGPADVRPPAGSEAQLRRLAESASLGVFLADRAGRGTWANPRLTTITGRSTQWLLGEDCSVMVHPEDRAGVLARLRAFLASTEPSVRDEFRVMRPDGAERRVVVEAWRVAGAEGGAESFAGTVEDVTERRALEARAGHLQRLEAVGRLAGGIAHDFNNLLTIIRAHTEFLAADLPEGDARDADVHQVLAATERAAALARQLLAFSRRQPSAARTVDPHKAIRELAPVLERLLGRDVHLELSLDVRAGTVTIDPAKLEQVLLNLAQNGRDAMPDGGSLLISTRFESLTREDIAEHARWTSVPPGTEEPGDFVVLAVTDDGVGMEAATQARVFEPFFSTKPPGDGVGLGLATVWGIVTQAGGHLRMRSAPGEGATMEVWLPRAAVRRRTPSSGITLTPAETAANRTTILVVEDEPAVRGSVRRILERAGYGVLEARHGLEARLIWESRRNEIALVLSDVVMPEVDGTELASALRALSTDVRFLFMSGFTGDEPADQRRPGPRDLVVEKPFDARTLLEHVRLALESRA